MAPASDSTIENETMIGTRGADVDDMVIDSDSEESLRTSYADVEDDETKVEPPTPDLNRSDNQAGKQVSSDSDDVPISFPQRLLTMLEAETKSGQEIVTWLPHGKAFIIYQKKRFASEVLACHFKQSKFTSFTRKLNRWGFTRITTGPETGAYYHPLFQRKNSKLCLQMYCQNYGPSQATLNQKLSRSIEKATSHKRPTIKLPASALLSMSILEIPEYADALAKSRSSTRPLMLAIRKTLQRMS